MHSHVTKFVMHFGYLKNNLEDSDINGKKFVPCAPNLHISMIAPVKIANPLYIHIDQFLLKLDM